MARDQFLDVHDGHHVGRLRLQAIRDPADVLPSPGRRMACSAGAPRRYARTPVETTPPFVVTGSRQIRMLLQHGCPTVPNIAYDEHELQR